MTTPVSSSTSQTLYSTSPLSDGNYPAQLPTDPVPPPSNPTDEVSISPEAKQLLAFRTAQNVVENPIATAAVSNNPQVDKVATNIYAAQQTQRVVDAYTGAASSSSSSGQSGSERNPLAIAAVSNNPETDKLATTVYASRTAQDIVDTYQQASQSANSQHSSSIDETA